MWFRWYHIISYDIRGFKELFHSPQLDLSLKAVPDLRIGFLYSAPHRLLHNEKWIE